MIQLQSILLPDKAVCEISELYYHKKVIASIIMAILICFM